MPLPASRVSTGIAGLDEILNGGLIPGRAYLLRGGPGTGKTTLGIRFLSSASAEERSLCITLEEPVERIRQNAAARGFNLDRVSFLDASPTSDFFAESQAYDIFSAAEVEREPLTQKIIERVSEVQPTRVFLDPLTQFRYLSADVFQFRKQTLSFLRYLTEQGATVLFASEESADAPDNDLQFISDGVINLLMTEAGRFIKISKLRGSPFQPGAHSLKMTERGLEVFPILRPNVQKKGFSFEMISSGVPALDKLLNGGIERGAITMITGPSGVGKTTLGLQFMKEAAARGERSVVYAFEEEPELILKRCDSVNIPARAMIEKGYLRIKKVEPLQYSADEFSFLAREDVEKNGASVVMLDSVTGYKLTLRGEELQPRLHALAKYLQNLGVAVVVTNEVEGVTGDFHITEAGLSYLADNVIFLRYLEIDGEIRKAIGVVKKRLSDFEKSLREIQIGKDGIKVGKALKGMRGILSGQPELIPPKKQSRRHV